MSYMSFIQLRYLFLVQQCTPRCEMYLGEVREFMDACDGMGLYSGRPKMDMNIK
uniref:Uncharacterized protein n=1 Tax=Anguilla anguilla TaxID=7936 RepID=A0A0E9TTM4_ANGAN